MFLRLVRIAVLLAVGAALFLPAPDADPGDTLPGAPPLPAALRTRLASALAARRPGDEPRIRHRRPDGSPRYTNRLLLEDSPYLRQHAHNPVDWYPWGDEAFARAQAEGRPVLLSVGYSSCHWCHVMEEESFDDEEIATELNRDYIAVKVDRERRPDVDAIYMSAVQAMSGNGGWPMTVWLTPDRQPFFGGTYYPPRDGMRGEQAGFLTLLRKVAAVYRAKPADATAAAADVSARVRRLVAVAPGDRTPGADVLRRAYVHFRDTFDGVNGGFGGAPKFPRSVELEFLLRYHRRTGEPAARAMVERTLDAIAAGGMRDQLGGGFHRYSTDAGWHVPHFEKMLYDNALLAVAYLDAYQVTRREDFADVARDTLAWVAREMTSPEGTFWAAVDADSDGEEGKFYTWTADEMRAALGDDAPLALAYWDVVDAADRQVPQVPRPLPGIAIERGLDPRDAINRIGRARARLLEVRRQRVPPRTDRKVITAWNGLMISAFARAATVLDEPAQARLAGRAADFALGRMRDGGRLLRSSLDGRASGEAYLEDYSFLIGGLLDLYQATFDPRWLREAVALQGVLDAHYSDPAGGYFRTADDGEPLLAREKPSVDSAEPSGNSVALGNLLRLAELTADDRYRERADAGLRALAPVLARVPAAAPRLLAAVDFRLDRPKEIVIVMPGASDAAELLGALRAAYVPNAVVAVVREGESQRALATLVPLVAEKQAVGGRATAYVCERRVCDLPTSDAGVLAGQLGRVAPLPES